MSSSSPHIDYYLTPISPWTLLGAERFRRIVTETQASVDLHVVDYGTIFPQTGGLPLPKRAPARLNYRMMELKRFREFLDIPIVLEPAHFPSQTRLTSYAILAVNELYGSHAGMDAAAAMMKGLWIEDRDMDARQHVEDMLNTISDQIGHSGGRSGAEILAHADANQEKYDQKITDDTEKALAANVFGAPSYVVDGEVFWGQDRVDLLAWRLGVTL